MGLMQQNIGFILEKDLAQPQGDNSEQESELNGGWGAGKGSRAGGWGCQEAPGLEGLSSSQQEWGGNARGGRVIKSHQGLTAT